MNNLVAFVASREHERVVIGPPRANMPPNWCLVPNTWAVCSWAARQKISFAKWHADLDGWVVYGDNVPEEWRSQNKIVATPELKIEECRTPSKRARSGAPPAGSVSRRTRSRVEHDVGNNKKDKSKSTVIELYDSPVRDTSLSLTPPPVEAVEFPLAPTTEAVSSLSLDLEGRTYRRKTTTRKTTTHRAKVARLDVESSSGEVNP